MSMFRSSFVARNHHFAFVTAGGRAQAIVDGKHLNGIGDDRTPPPGVAFGYRPAVPDGLPLTFGCAEGRRQPPGSPPSASGATALSRRRCRNCAEIHRPRHAGSDSIRASSPTRFHRQDEGGAAGGCAHPVHRFRGAGRHAILLPATAGDSFAQLHQVRGRIPPRPANGRVRRAVAARRADQRSGARRPDAADDPAAESTIRRAKRPPMCWRKSANGPARPRSEASAAVVEQRLRAAFTRFRMEERSRAFGGTDAKMVALGDFNESGYKGFAVALRTGERLQQHHRKLRHRRHIGGHLWNGWLRPVGIQRLRGKATGRLQPGLPCQNAPGGHCRACQRWRAIALPRPCLLGDRPDRAGSLADSVTQGVWVDRSAKIPVRHAPDADTESKSSRATTATR